MKKLIYFIPFFSFMILAGYLAYLDKTWGWSLVLAVLFLPTSIKDKDE